MLITAFALNECRKDSLLACSQIMEVALTCLLGSSKIIYDFDARQGKIILQWMPKQFVVVIYIDKKTL